ncbi:unnamed protein product [Bemisia tabaci]|uniref:Uncharacterized protein n=1 Tax=Bemisia tabaci TaxID=7038 RepID=A0A9P0F6G3_BEMTA|nr:unnamed protein product [Bemisia tabaci]
MSSGTFVDRIDPFAKRSLKKKTKKSQGSSRYRNSADVELQQLPALKAIHSGYLVTWKGREVKLIRKKSRKETAEPLELGISVPD